MGDLLEEALQESGYVEALQAERTIEAEGRVENLQELVGVAREYDQTAAQPSLAEFLQQISLYADQDSLRVDEGLLTLMTLHNAKGLEYPVVFMIGCEEGIFPHSRSLDEGNLEEERRLCYVGITRARRSLTLTHASSRGVYGSRGFALPSRFLAEIPPELTDAESEQPAVPGPPTRWDRGGPAAPPHPAPPAFARGDDVVHAKFGDGVVTAVEPGGVVTVRFAGDGSERKLMSDYAPLRKR